MSRAEEERLNTLAFSAAMPGLAFEIKRRAHPEAAFAELFERLKSALAEDGDIKLAFDALKSFKATAVTSEQASRLASLTRTGNISLSEFAVGSLPASMGPGLAFMHDAALEALRTKDSLRFAEWSHPRVIRALAESMQEVLPHIGAASVTAIEYAVSDPQFRGRLSERANQLGKVYLNNLPPGTCDYCQITIRHDDGTVETHCGTEDECESMGGLLLLWLGITLAAAIWDWISGLF